MPYTTGTASGHEDLLEKFRRWICGYGTAAAAVPGANTGDGTVTGIDTTPDTITETWTLTCTAAATNGGTFSVVGSVSGAQANATVGTPYSNSFISFTINDGAADFIVGDSFTIAATVGAMSSAGYAWQQQTFDTVTNAGLAWTRSGTTYTITLNNNTLAVGEVVDTSSCSTSGFTNGSKTLTGRATNTVSFTGDNTKSGLSWSRSGTTATVTWTNHGLTTGNSITVSASSDITAISNGSKTVTVVNANTFTFTCSNAGGASGTLTSTLPTSGTITLTLQETHLYLKGLGNGGTDEIFVNLRGYKSALNGYYNIELRGATGFSSGAGKTRINQAGISPLVDLCLWSSSIPYWFIANGRRFMIIAKVGTVYESAYCGFILPTGLPSEYPYPLAIGGSQGLTRKLYSANTGADSYSHAAFFNPGNYDLLQDRTTLYLIDKTGVWRRFANKDSNSDMATTYTGRVFPFGYARSLSTSKGSPIYPNIDGTYTLFPVTMVSRIASPASKDIFGDFEGVYHVSGHNNASENIVQVGGVDHVVIQNTFRTDKDEYAAFALS